jgi:hypothetical protein
MRPITVVDIIPPGVLGNLELTGVVDGAWLSHATANYL